ncbi:Crp/Fnr family transcriptional regulator [Flavobacterium sp. F-380]|jgi:CRP/FNR family transcriptional regulator|uniref:Crp/Fnr family transcriptional regulator n=1 Tax=Flavobacterium kayseriense TaxID=2764714 RepID=A0ABR7JAQ5_9FLAO|nr:Crp/Fnr family transcriptional regulator [Flavobacterium kayseriense]MBC5842614.1 Crp/Fnr family transcriptional regulator [Flavobacterium kayseriense]MBC5849144.1 Crp/Fnr family transcriptional regulator [Flavobacterium kayseriense]MBU0942122.1 Crp/Fnr family transcriptional regulator [Bacteroidota bacterium]
MKNILKQNYGYVFEDNLIDEIAQVASIRDFKEGDVLIDFGDYIKKMPLLISGAIKILREDFDEGELLLYFIEKGDTCAMTMSCCIGETKSEIKAIAETNGQVVMIPIEKMEEWLGKYKTWRNFVFSSYNNRLKEMLTSIDNLAFMNMNDRLLKYLFEKAKINHTKEVLNTHQEIAYDLHTSRVVISRLLKALENQGKIKLHRASIELIS